MEDKETVTLLPGQTIIGTKYTKSSYVEQLEKENAELKAYKDVNEDFKTAWTELKAENERLKEENFNFEEIVKLCRCEQYKQTLQEIKAIADIRCNECKYGKDGISCKYGDCGEAKLHLITQLITKAESEEE